MSQPSAVGSYSFLLSLLFFGLKGSIESVGIGLVRHGRKGKKNFISFVSGRCYLPELEGRIVSLENKKGELYDGVTNFCSHFYFEEMDVTYQTRKYSKWP